MMITLKPMTVEACNVILRALGELPLKDCVGLWLDIKTQAEQQIAEANKPIDVPES